jgi:hypothetical protein
MGALAYFRQNINFKEVSLLFDPIWVFPSICLEIMLVLGHANSIIDLDFEKQGFKLSGTDLIKFHIFVQWHFSWDGVVTDKKSSLILIY